MADEEKIHYVAFDNLTTENLTKKFSEEILKANPGIRNPSYASEEAEVFIGCLEGFANSSLISNEASLPKMESNQRRREKTEAFANALDKLIDTIADMDDASLSYAIFRGLGDASTHPMADTEFLNNVSIYWQGENGLFPARELKDAKPLLGAFALGVRKAVDDLPIPSKGRQSIEEGLAVWIEDYLGRMRIPCTTSDTGLAGSAFLAVMHLIDPSKEYSAKNWLYKAVQSPESWKSFVRRLADKES